MNFLFRLRPPHNVRPTKESGLWWAVIRQAVKDIEYGHEQQAIDGYDFLSSTGLWLLLEYYHVSESKAINAIATVVRRYNARTGSELGR